MLGKHASGVTICLEQECRQVVSGVLRVNGLVRAKGMIPLIDYLDLAANPRASKTGAVTAAIQDSIRHDTMLFPLKTKGILLAASGYRSMDDGKTKLRFLDRDVEGILDGGHNMLAVGMTILEVVAENQGFSVPKRSCTWTMFKELWNSHRHEIDDYLSNDSVDSVGLGTAQESAGSMLRHLDFYVPVEILVPEDPDRQESVVAFRGALSSICAARNNNAQLTAGALANQRGYFDGLQVFLRERDPQLADRIEWKTNDGGCIKVQDLIALAWIPLSLVPAVEDASGRIISPPSPVKMYSSKGECLTVFERLMDSPKVSVADDTNGYKIRVTNDMVVQALRRATEIPKLYDCLYDRFPVLYNQAGGVYGRISAVKSLNARRRNTTTPFGGRNISIASPDGFIVPLAYGLVSLINPETLEWRVDPCEFMGRSLGRVVSRYMEVLPACGFDPQKVGKSLNSYNFARDSFLMEYMECQSAESL